MTNAHVLESPTHAAVRWIGAYYVAWLSHALRRVQGCEPFMLALHYAVGLVRLRESCIELTTRLRVLAGTAVTSGIAMIFIT